MRRVSKRAYTITFIFIRSILGHVFVPTFVAVCKRFLSKVACGIVARFINMRWRCISHLNWTKIIRMQFETSYFTLFYFLFSYLVGKSAFDAIQYKLEFKR